MSGDSQSDEVKYVVSWERVKECPILRAPKNERTNWRTKEKQRENKTKEKKIGVKGLISILMPSC